MDLHFETFGGDFLRPFFRPKQTAIIWEPGILSTLRGNPKGEGGTGEEAAPKKKKGGRRDVAAPGA